MKRFLLSTSSPLHMSVSAFLVEDWYLACQSWDKPKCKYTNIRRSQYIGKRKPRLALGLLQIREKELVLPNGSKVWPKFWHQTNCLPNLLNLPIFWLHKNWLATKQALKVSNMIWVSTFVLNNTICAIDLFLKNKSPTFKSMPMLVKSVFALKQF